MVGPRKKSPLDDEAAERRVVTRTRISRNAKIIVAHRNQVVFCTVENITNGGACLKLATLFARSGKNLGGNFSCA